MYISIQSLEGFSLIVSLASVGNVFEDDDIIYFDGVPCRLSSARALPENESTVDVSFIDF